MSLCDRCRQGLIYERLTGEMVYHCLALMGNDHIRIPADIVDCSRFEDGSQPEIYEMREIAWKVEPGPNGRIKGFKPPPREK